MGTHQFHSKSTRRSVVARAVVVVAVPAVLASVVPATADIPSKSPSSPSSPSSPTREPVLLGRAVLPVMTSAGPPAAGAFVVPGPGVLNGITFPLDEQPVEGFSSIVEGRARGEFLAMEDNGFGSKANSRDFLIRAYFIRPHFKTAHGGSGTVEVRSFISFRDPFKRLGFPIVNERSTSRLLTGGDIDPESLQRGPHGDLWVGDEFGPWILHFDSRGRLLDPPYEVPGIKSPNNPTLAGGTATQPNSRGFEAMAIGPHGRHLYAALEGPTLADVDKNNRNVYEFSTHRREFTGRVLHYQTEAPGNLVADMWGVGRHHVVVIERDLGSGEKALFRRLYLVDLNHAGPTGFLEKRQLVDLTAVPDPGLVSLPAVHEGDLGLGDPFWVMCESVEAVHLLAWNRLLVGCDNNLPNSGRNPALPDDSEFIVVRAAGLTTRH